MYDYLNTSDSNNESSSENSESKQDFSKNPCKNACLEVGNGTSKVRNSKNIEGERNTNGNQAVLLENRWKGNFVIKNVVNLLKRNLTDAEISLLLKGLIFFQHATRYVKLKLKWNWRPLVECYVYNGILLMKTRILIATCPRSILVIKMQI